jgi:hypothetical protein
MINVAFLMEVSNSDFLQGPSRPDSTWVPQKPPARIHSHLMLMLSRLKHLEVILAVRQIPRYRQCHG